MAQTLATHVSAPRSFSVVRGIVAWFDDIAGAIRASRDCQKLYAMSDSQLARLGLRRDEIARHVYKLNLLS